MRIKIYKYRDMIYQQKDWLKQKINSEIKEAQKLATSNKILKIDTSNIVIEEAIVDFTPVSYEEFIKEHEKTS